MTRQSRSARPGSTARRRNSRTSEQPTYRAISSHRTDPSSPTSSRCRAGQFSAEIQPERLVQLPARGCIAGSHTYAAPYAAPSKKKSAQRRPPALGLANSGLDEHRGMYRRFAHRRYTRRYTRGTKTACAPTPLTCGFGGWSVVPPGRGAKNLPPDQVALPRQAPRRGGRSAGSERRQLLGQEAQDIRKGDQEDSSSRRGRGRQADRRAARNRASVITERSVRSIAVVQPTVMASNSSRLRDRTTAEIAQLIAPRAASKITIAEKTTRMYTSGGAHSGSTSHGVGVRRIGARHTATAAVAKPNAPARRMRLTTLIRVAHVDGRRCRVPVSAE